MLWFNMKSKQLVLDFQDILDPAIMIISTGLRMGHLLIRGWKKNHCVDFCWFFEIVVSRTEDKAENLTGLTGKVLVLIHVPWRFNEVRILSRIQRVLIYPRSIADVSHSIFITIDFVVCYPRWFVSICGPRIDLRWILRQGHVRR